MQSNPQTKPEIIILQSLFDEPQFSKFYYYFKTAQALLTQTKGEIEKENDPHYTESIRLFGMARDLLNDMPTDKDDKKIKIKKYFLNGLEFWKLFCSVRKFREITPQKRKALEERASKLDYTFEGVLRYQINDLKSLYGLILPLGLQESTFFEEKKPDEKVIPTQQRKPTKMYPWGGAPAPTSAQAQPTKRFELFCEGTRIADKWKENYSVNESKKNESSIENGLDIWRKTISGNAFNTFPVNELSIENGLEILRKTISKNAFDTFLEEINAGLKNENTVSPYSVAVDDVQYFVNAGSAYSKAIKVLDDFFRKSKSDIPSIAITFRNSAKLRYFYCMIHQNNFCLVAREMKALIAAWGMSFDEIKNAHPPACVHDFIVPFKRSTFICMQDKISDETKLITQKNLFSSGTVSSRQQLNTLDTLAIKNFINDLLKEANIHEQRGHYEKALERYETILNNLDLIKNRIDRGNDFSTLHTGATQKVLELRKRLLAQSSLVSLYSYR